MSIPTGADYQICIAKSDLNEARERFYLGMDKEDVNKKLFESIAAIIRAIELMRREQERKEQ